jgi:integrase
MAGSANKLTARMVSQAKTPGLFADGEGLFLQVTTGRDGSPRRSWLVRYTAPDGRRREMGLGRVEYLDLAEARQAARDARKRAAAGIDPIEARSAKKSEAAMAVARAISFQQCAEAFIAAHEASWKNAKHRQQWRNTLDRYVHPVIGQIAVSEIDQTMIMEVLDAIWHSKPETARRVRGRIESIIDWAIVRGHREGANPARWRHHLENVLPAADKVRRVQHHRAVPVAEMPAVYKALMTRTGAGADCLKLLILTATRFSEAAGARWREFDLLDRVWVIPPDRMKAGREHRVPLSQEAVRLLDTRRAMIGEPPAEALVFESDMRKSAKLSDMALTALMRRMGRTETVHGFRSTFRDFAAEETDFPSEVAEAALAHTVRDEVERAYRRSDLFVKRRNLAETWSKFCCSESRASAHVVRLRQGDRNGG